MTHSVASAAAGLHDRALVWDNHACMPLRPDADLSELQRFTRSGANVVFLNVGFDLIAPLETVKVLSHFRAWLLERPDDYVLIDNVQDIVRARDTGRLAVGFDIEGANALDGQISMIPLYYELGVRWMLLAYNQTNIFAAGCNDEDGGLTDLGGAAIDEMNRVGMIVCCSHTSFTSTMDIMERSADPVTFSHSNPLTLATHRRNITDEQIKACAATDGVIGINGVGRFLGDPETRSETIARHVDYVAQLVGPRHVGLGLDFVFDLDELHDFHVKRPELFPEGANWSRDQATFAAPEQLPEVTDCLARLGYAESDIRGVLGENLLRVATRVWK